MCVKDCRNGLESRVRLEIGCENRVISAQKEKKTKTKQTQMKLALLLSELTECINFPCKYVRGAKGGEHVRRWRRMGGSLCLRYRT